MSDFERLVCLISSTQVTPSTLFIGTFFKDCSWFTASWAKLELASYDMNKHDQAHEDCWKKAQFDKLVAY